MRTPCTLPLDPPPLLQKLQFLPLSEAAGITHSCVDSAGEGRGALYSHVFLLNGLTLLVRRIGFASSAILKILQQTCTASVGSDSLSYGPLHSNSLSYPILSYVFMQ